MSLEPMHRANDEWDFLFKKAKAEISVLEARVKEKTEQVAGLAKENRLLKLEVASLLNRLETNVKTD